MVKANGLIICTSINKIVLDSSVCLSVGLDFTFTKCRWSHESGFPVTVLIEHNCDDRKLGR